MYEDDNDKKRKLTTYETLFLLTISIIFNTLGNGLSVASNMGSAMWTAAAANISNDFDIDIGIVLMFFGTFSVIVNSILLKRIDWHRILGNLIFIFPYSILVGFWTHLFLHLGVGELNVSMRICLTIVGIVILSTAVSIYQRVNVILHPNDDMTNIIRFNYVHGNPVIAQALTFAIPLAIALTLWAIFGQIISFNIGTLFSFLFQGTLIGISDKFIFKHLKHKLTEIDLNS